MQQSRPPVSTRTDKISNAPAVITFAIACCAFGLAVVLSVAISVGQ